jgi:hypothetical protein
MPPMISYSIGYTAIDADGTTVTVTPPPAYAAGDLLVMGVIGGGTSGAVAPSATPSGWTKPSGEGALGVFYKTAGSEPDDYTVTFGSDVTAAVFVAAYPAASVVSSAFHASSSAVASYLRRNGPSRRGCGLQPGYRVLGPEQRHLPLRLEHGSPGLRPGAADEHRLGLHVRLSRW